MHTKINTWTDMDSCSDIRQFILDNQLYEKSYGCSRFKRFADVGDKYNDGFSIKLYDDNNDIVGLLLASNIKDLTMPGGLRKKTRDYGYSGKLVETLEHQFKILADVGVYIKPEYRGLGYSKILLSALETNILPIIFTSTADYNDIPVFVFHDPLYQIAEKSLVYSRPVKNAYDSSGLRESLHYWSILEKPMHKYDPFPMSKPILHWHEILDKYPQVIEYPNYF